VRQLLPSLVARVRRDARMYSAFFHRKSAKVEKSDEIEKKIQKKKNNSIKYF
jgi:hypothetical protein